GGGGAPEVRALPGGRGVPARVRDDPEVLPDAAVRVPAGRAAREVSQHAAPEGLVLTVSDADDLDAIVTELNAGLPRTSRDDEQLSRFLAWLDEVVARSASDLLLVAGAPPSLRIEGVVVPLGLTSGGPLGSEEIEDAVLPARPPHARRMYRDSGIADGSYRESELGRFRINLHRERG